MKKTTRPKKLELKPERIRTLTAQQLDTVAGGGNSGVCGTHVGDSGKPTCSCANCPPAV